MNAFLAPNEAFVCPTLRTANRPGGDYVSSFTFYLTVSC
jgi:hypothetical protein